MKLHFIAYFIIFPIALFSKYNTNTDSLLSVVNTLQENEQSRTYIKLARHYAFVENDSVSFTYIKKALESAKDDETRGLALFWNAFVHQAFNDDINELRKLDMAYDLFQNTNDSLAAEALYWKSRALQRKGMYPEALATGLQEVELTEKLPSLKKHIRSLQEVGYTYDRMSDFEKAIEWYEKALKIAVKTTNKTTIGRSYGLIGIAYDELQEYDLALVYNLKAISYFEQVKDSNNLVTWYSNVGNTYTKMDDLKNAELYLLKSLKMSGGNKSEIARVNLAKVYLEQGKYEQAEELLQSTLTALLKDDKKQFVSEAYYRLHELRKKQDRYKEALAFFEKYKEIQDEMLNEAKFEQINKMTIQYETYKKVQALAEEKLKVTQHELSLKNKNNLLLIFGILIITTVLLALIFILLQRFKNRQLIKEKELSAALSKIQTNNKLQKQRLEISSDLHDNIGAQLTFIISSIESLKLFLSAKDNKTANKLNYISQFTKDTIQQLRDTIWAMNKESISLEDLKVRISNFINQAKVSLQGISFSFNYDEDKFNNKDFNSTLGMNVYRIIQEAVNNAIKHAEATEIIVNFHVDNHTAFVDIIDNGKGIDIANISEGNGIINIKKRALEINGTVNLKQLEKGTKVSLQFPCKTN